MGTHRKYNKPILNLEKKKFYYWNYLQCGLLLIY